jgi:isoaspartyl peptidase/L-asparaginase-like protein (Ntn-hydrolase superfamily)
MPKNFSPIILSTWTFGQIANAAGWPVLKRGGKSIDAVEQACIAVESDPQVDSVGIGGTPDADGNVTLDGSIMLSPEKCAGVGCIRHYAHPVSIARKVMERTTHKLLVGEGAEKFAAANGFKKEKLLTKEARDWWKKWKADPQRHNFHRTSANRPNREEARLRNRVGAASAAAPRRKSPKSHDTVGVLAIDSNGTIAGACSTSGWAFKLPGRVGDSPIIGAGLYVDPTVGAAVATGMGELMLGTCATFLVVERMRAGDSPQQAIQAVLERVAKSYNLKKRQQCALIALRTDGQWSTGGLVSGFRAAITTPDQNELQEQQITYQPA